MPSRHLVIGASGMVGGTLVQGLLAHGHTVFAPQHAQCDLEDIRSVREALECDPDYVHLVAAQTDVDLCEREPARTRVTNVTGPMNVVNALRELEKRPVLVYFSSDYIFGDGGPHPTRSAASPLQEYGRQKLAAEHYVTLHYSMSCVVRTSWVWDAKKGFVANLMQAQKMLIAKDQWGTPTYAPHLVTYFLPLLFRQRTPKVLHLAGPLTSRFQWANDAKLMLGLPVEFELVTHQQLGYTAPRPVRGGSVSTVSLPDHMEALRDVRRELGR
jgi:dTDP-4-dehydrorhamnose reductase